MTTHTAEKGLPPQPVGRPQGGMKSDAGKAAYWRMQYESAIGALADLIAENTENVEAVRAVLAAWDQYVETDDIDQMSEAIGRLRTCVIPPGSGDTR